MFIPINYQIEFYEANKEDCNYQQLPVLDFMDKLIKSVELIRKDLEVQEKHDKHK